MTDPRIKISILDIERDYIGLAVDVVSAYLRDHAAADRNKRSHGVGYGRGTPHFYV